MAKSVKLTDLVTRLSGRPKTIDAPATKDATPALALLLQSPTRLKEQLEANLPGMTISIKRTNEGLKITSAKKVVPQPQSRRLPSKKPGR